MSETEAVHNFNSLSERLRSAKGRVSVTSPEVVAKAAADRDARDRMIYDLHADELNAEAADVLEYQTLPE